MLIVYLSIVKGRKNNVNYDKEWLVYSKELDRVFFAFVVRFLKKEL